MEFIVNGVPKLSSNCLAKEPLSLTESRGFDVKVTRSHAYAFL